METNVSPRLTTGQVAQLLGMKPAGVRQLAIANQLPYTREGGGLKPRYLFRLEDVERYAASRSYTLNYKRKAFRAQLCARQEYILEEKLCGDYVSVAEAAGMLGLKPRAVRSLVARRKLVGLQDQPGQRGSRLRILRHSIQTLLGNQKYNQARSRRTKQGNIRPRRRALTAEQARATAPTQEWLNVRQAAQWLGLSITNLRQLQYHGWFEFATRKVPIGQKGVRVAYNRDSLIAMLENPEYVKRRASRARAEETQVKQDNEWLRKYRPTRSESPLAFDPWASGPSFW